ncbi:MAG TPA: hypothetical protein VFO73_03380 [Candidatus Limnocylindrales bacterium]|nr:hypothetical protein [Candidatus Limnocylindrales bacterium]
MDPRNAAERAVPKGPECGDPEAIEFVRFCYRRRRVGWPELYDEMCAVAGRGLYRGYDADDLSTIGIGFALYQMPTLAAIVQRVVAEEHERRRLTAVPARAAFAAAEATPEPGTPSLVPAPATEAEAAESHPRLVAVAVGA